MTGTDLCVNNNKSVPVIFEPPCIFWSMKITIHFSSMAFVPDHTHAHCAQGSVSQVWMKYINGVVGRM